MSLKQRFLIGFSLSMAALGVFFAILLSMNLRDQLVTDTEHKASLVLSQAEAIQTYVRDTLRPLMYSFFPPDTFIVEAMSTSYVTRRILGEMSRSDEQIRYRRVAVGARNPMSEADAFERALMERFAANPHLTRIEEITKWNKEEVFIAARPVRLDPSCLHCHGDPADAPKALLERYGERRGFWRQANELVGLDLVIAPVAGALTQIKGKTIGFLSMFAVGLVTLYLTVQLFFDRLVVANLRRVTETLRRYFPQEVGETSPMAPPTGDEIEEIYAGIETLAARLKEARRDIEEHAANLEHAVAARTQQLSQEAQERRADVALFVDLLHHITLAHSNIELLRAVLPRLAERFSATWAFYQCASAEGSVIWPEQTQIPPLPDNWRTLIAAGEVVLTDDEVRIPVRTLDMSRGLLRLHFAKHGPHPAAHALHFYQAIGHQLGLALENLDAIHALMAQNTLLESIFNGISDPLALVDSSRAIILANAPARALALEAPQTPADPTTVRLPARLLAAAEAGAKAAPLESTITLDDGRSFAVARYPIASPPGAPQRFVVYARENTTERHMLEQLRRSERLAAVGKLAAGLAHEINNPLGVITCYTELLRQYLTDPQALEDLAVIERHAAQAKKVLRDLLDFARSRPAQPGPCDIHALLRGLERIFQVQAQTRHVGLCIETPSSPLMALADPNALEQVLSNLLLNALDAVPPNTGQITITASAYSPTEVRITVADNGPGIAETDLPHIFDPFFTTKAAGQGTGLGLALVFSLMRDMQGTIEVHNDAGAVFTLTLPAYPTTITEGHDDHQPPSPHR